MYKFNDYIHYDGGSDIALLKSTGLIPSLLWTGGIVLCIIYNTVALEDPSTQQDVHDTGYYQTLQELIDNTSEGVQLLLPPGVYYEHLIVNKSITLKGADNHSTILNGSGAGIIMYISATNVTLSNCHIEHGNIGIYLKGNNSKKSQVILYNITITKTNASMYLSGISNGSLLHSTLEGNVDGITLYHSSYVTLSGNTMRNNTNTGIGIGDMSHHNTITANHLILNRQGIRLCRQSHNNTITGNHLENNTVGVHSEFTSDTTVTDNVFIHNDCGLRIQHSQKNNSFFHNVFQENSCAVSMMGSTEDMQENNTFRNNTMNFKQESSVPQIHTPGYGLAFLLGVIVVVALVRKAGSFA